MNASNRETLSALMDGEAEELEFRRLLRDLDGDGPDAEELRACWYRQHLVRAVMTGEETRHAPGFAGRVARAIETSSDETAAAHAGSVTGGWRRSLGSFAVAASVAALVVVGGQQLGAGAGGSDDGSERMAPLPTGVVNTTGAVPVQASYGTRAVPTLQPADRTAYRELARQRLRRYSLEHAEHASLNTPQGLVPFARVPAVPEAER